MPKKNQAGDVTTVGLVQMSCEQKPETNLKESDCRNQRRRKARRADRLPAGALSLAVLLPD
jgi:hypothetical protein